MAESAQEQINRELARFGSVLPPTTAPTIPAPSADVESLLRTARVVKQVLDAMNGAGSAADRVIRVNDLLPSGQTTLSLPDYTFSGGGGTGGGTGGDLGYVDPRPVLSTPPTPTGLTVRGTLKAVLLDWQLTPYRNHAYTQVYRSTSDDLGTAVMIGTAVADLYQDLGAAAGVVYYYWVRAVGYAELDGTLIFGAYNAVAGTSGGLGRVGNVDLGPLVVEAANLASGAVTGAKLAALAVDLTKFANGIEPVGLYGSVPGSKTAADPNVIMVAGKLYRWNGTAYDQTVPVTDLLGQITSTQITDGAITTPKIATNSITANKLVLVPAAQSIFPDPNIEDPSLWGYGGYGVTATRALVTDGATGGYVWRSPVGGTASVDGLFKCKTVPGRRYRVSAKFRSSGGTGQCYLRLVYWLMPANQWWDQTVVSPALEVIVPGASWATYTGIWTCPPDVAYISPRIILNYIDGAGQQEVQDIRIEEMTDADLVVDGSITGNKLVANTITAGQIAAGAIGTTQLAAGAVTTGKLLVTGRGAALNADPTFQDQSAWALFEGSFPTLVTDSDGPGGPYAYRFTNLGAIRSLPIPVVADKQYRVSAYIRRLSGTGYAYIRLYCFNAAGTLLSYAVNSTFPTWSGNLEVVPVPATWTRYGGVVTVPTGTTQAYIVLYANDNTTGVSEAQDFRCEEYVGADLIVDGAITANKLSANAIAVGTAAVQNGAITNAMIANAAIDTAKIADAAIVSAKIGDLQVTNAKIADATITDAKIVSLQATKISAGTLSAGVVYAGSLDAGQITTGTLISNTFNGTVVGGIITDEGTAGWAIGKDGQMVVEASLFRQQKAVAEQGRGYLYNGAGSSTPDFIGQQPFSIITLPKTQVVQVGVNGTVTLYIDTISARRLELLMAVYATQGGTTVRSGYQRVSAYALGGALWTPTTPDTYIYHFPVALTWLFAGDYYRSTAVFAPGTSGILPTPVLETNRLTAGTWTIGLEVIATCFDVNASTTQSNIRFATASLSGWSLVHTGSPLYLPTSPIL